MTNTAYLTGFHSELTPDVGQGFSLLPVKPTYFDHVGICEPMVIGGFASLSKNAVVPHDPFSFRHVPPIVSFSTPIKVRWTNTTAVIAMVQGAQVFRKTSSLKHQRDSRRNNAFSLPLHHRPSCGSNRSGPQPTRPEFGFVLWNRSVLVNTSEEFIFDGHAPIVATQFQ